MLCFCSVGGSVTLLLLLRFILLPIELFMNSTHEIVACIIIINLLMILRLVADQGFT